MIVTVGGRRRLIVIGLRKLGNPEVENLDAAVACEEQVLGLEVAVHDAARVGRRQRTGNGDANLDHLPWRQGALIQALA